MYGYVMQSSIMRTHIQQLKASYAKHPQASYDSSLRHLALDLRAARGEQAGAPRQAAAAALLLCSMRHVQ